MYLSKKTVFFLLIGFAALTVWGVNAMTGKSNIAPVKGTAHDEAVTFAKQVITAAQKRQGKQFLALAENPKLLEPLEESFLFLHKAQLHGKPSWKVEKLKTNGDFNVYFDLSDGRQAVMILRKKDAGLKFIYAMVTV